MTITRTGTDAGAFAPLAPPPGWRAEPTAGAPTAGALATRLPSLDVLRGIVIALMVAVNNPGDEQVAAWPLRHVAWNGWTLTETIAPTFLWMVGVALALGAGRPGPDGRPTHKPFARVLRRAAVLFGLGVLIMATPRPFPLFDRQSAAALRIPGTLQRIALCYVAASALARVLRMRGLALSAVLLVVGYWTLMTLVPVPGYGAGVLTPTGNLAAYVDHLLLGQHAKGMDPLGVLSTLPAIATTLLGVITGDYVRRRPIDADTSARLFVGGLGLLGAGQVLRQWIPLNESLWTPSFVVFMGGISTLAFAACYWAVEVRGGAARWSRPLAVYGMNSLAVFVLSQMLAHALVGVGVPAMGRAWASPRAIVFGGLYLRVAPPAIASLLYAATWVIGLYVVARVLYRRNLILKA